MKGAQKQLERGRRRAAAQRAREAEWEARRCKRVLWFERLRLRCYIRSQLRAGHAAFGVLDVYQPNRTQEMERELVEELKRQYPGVVYCEIPIWDKYDLHCNCGEQHLPKEYQYVVSALGEEIPNGRRVVLIFKQK